MTRRDLYTQKLVKEANEQASQFFTRRHFLRESAFGLGGLAVGALFGCNTGKAKPENIFNAAEPMAARIPQFPGKAKSVIYLHMAGAPSQLELFDFKPELQKLNGQDCPPSLLEGKRFAFIRGVPKMMGPQANFLQRGESGAWVSDNLPHFATEPRP